MEHILKGQTFAGQNFVDFHILCEGFSHVLFSQFCPNISLYSSQAFSLLQQV